MDKLKYMLRLDYENTLNVSGDCLPIERLCNYAKGGLSPEERSAVESHISDCYHCLDIIASFHEGAGFRKKRKIKLKGEYMFLSLALFFFLSSFAFSRYFLQFLAAAIIFGIKWIVDSKNTRMLITIHEAWKKGGEKETGKALKDMEFKNRIKF